MPLKYGIIGKVSHCIVVLELSLVAVWDLANHKVAKYASLVHLRDHSADVPEQENSSILRHEQSRDGLRR